MNDLVWIKYFPQTMFADTAGMSATAERAHRRLMDYLWYNDGPPFNDNEGLRLISQTSSTDWGRTKLELLRKGWVEAGDFFLHRGAILSLNESKETTVANHNRTAAANRLPLKSISQPDPVTGIIRIVDVTTPATHSVTSCVTPPMTPTRITDTDTVTGLSPTLKGVQGESEGETAWKTSPVLTEQNVTRIANDLVKNSGGWFYDNCRVKPEMFDLRSMITVLRGYMGQVQECSVRPAFAEAVTITHQKCVDFEKRDPIRKPGGVCIAEFRKILTALVKTNG